LIAINHCGARFLFAVCGLLLTALTHAERPAPPATQRVVDVAQISGGPIPLTEYFAILHDATTTLTLTDVQQPQIADRFRTGQPPAEALTLGFTEAAVWLRLHVKNDGNLVRETMIEIAMARHGSVQFHQSDADGHYQLTDTGYFKPFAERPYKNRFFVFPLTLQPHSEQTVYLRFQGPDGMDIPAFLWSREGYHAYERNDYIVQSLYFGIVLAMATFNFLLFVALRDRSYLYYVLFVCFTGLSIAAANGLGYEFLWGNSHYWAQIATLISANAALIFMCVFARSILDTRELTPRLDQLLKLAIGIEFALIVSLAVAFKSALQPALIAMPATAILVMATAITIALKRKRSAIFFIAAFAVLCIAVLVSILRSFGILPTNSFTVNGAQFGSAIEMLLLAFALADRYNILRSEKAKAQTEALQAQTEALEAEQRVVEALRSSERMLEERVEQRTNALQASNKNLEVTLDNLRNTQTQLIQSEKMAALGQLIAGVAHEINTPIGAVKSSGQNIADALSQSLESMPTLFRKLDPEALRLFMKLTRRTSEVSKLLNSREERAVTRATAQRLEALDINDARHLAGVLVQLNIHEVFEGYLPLLQHQGSELILETAHSIAKVVRNTGNINRAVGRVSKIIFALKSFSRVDATGEMIDVNLQDNMETVLTIYQGQIKQGTELVRHYEELPPLRCLPDELNQVWTNLIHNALQAMNYKGTLTIGIRKRGDEAIVSVADTGSGIPEEIRGRIFDAFFTTRPAGEGSGLGLDIVKKIVDNHKGRIELQTEMGIGTTFSVNLPYAV